MGASHIWIRSFNGLTTNTSTLPECHYLCLSLVVAKRQYFILWRGFTPPLLSSVKRDGLFGFFTRLCGKLTSAFNLGLLESGLAWPSCVQVAYLLALSGAFALK